MVIFGDRLKEMDSPGLVVGGVWEGMRMADALLPRPLGHWGSVRIRWNRSV